MKALLESLLKEGYEITFYRTGLKARKTYVILRKNGDAKAECASEHIEDALADAAMKTPEVGAQVWLRRFYRMARRWARATETLQETVHIEPLEELR